MAERLTIADGPADRLGNISQATILNFAQEMKRADDAIIDAKAEVRAANDTRKAILARIKDAGIRRDAFDRAYADSERVAEDREEEDRHYRYLMAMLGKPVEAAASFEMTKLTAGLAAAAGVEGTLKALRETESMEGPPCR